MLLFSLIKIKFTIHRQTLCAETYSEIKLHGQGIILTEMLLSL